MIASNMAHRISLAAGIAVLAMTIISMFGTKPQPCGDLSANYAPIIAFELARSVDDLHALFGSNPDVCRAAMVGQMDTVNRFDCLVYIPAYGAFLFFCCVGLASRGSRVGRIAAMLVLLACVADYVENVCLFKLTSNLDNESVWLAMLPWWTFAKWIALGLVSLLIGWALAAQGGWRRLLVFPCAVAIVATVAAVFMPASAGPFLSAAFAPSWIVAIIYVLIASLRPASISHTRA